MMGNLFREAEGERLSRPAERPNNIIVIFWDDRRCDRVGRKVLCATLKIIVMDCAFAGTADGVRSGLMY